MTEEITRNSRQAPLEERADGRNPSTFPLADGTVYSARKGFRPFATPPLEVYASLLGSARTDRVRRAAEKLQGLKVLELNSSAQGGGVAEMLYSSVPFLNLLGIESEWKIIRGSQAFFEITKGMHNLLQGKKGAFTAAMKEGYIYNLEDCARANLIEDVPDVVLIHDPQPMGLIHYLKDPRSSWLWRCHIDVEESTLRANPDLWEFITDLSEHYDAAIFSAAHYVVSCWPLPKFLIPPFIDPLSEKNRDLSRAEVEQVLEKYGIDAAVPIVAQIGRYDPWKGIDRTIGTFRHVRKEVPCQLVLAGGLATDDPEGSRVLAEVRERTEGMEDVHVLSLQMSDRLLNWKEVNALQRAATVIMQPSTKEGFGLVITEALWKSKPVIGADVGAIPLQIRNEETGFFFETAARTARKVVQLLKSPAAARKLGQRGREFVSDHFLMPDRLADFLQALGMVRSAGLAARDTCNECIISFHPWSKMSKRSR
ncbi:MAG: glycosyltransferase [bacterium]